MNQPVLEHALPAPEVHQEFVQPVAYDQVWENLGVSRGEVIQLGKVAVDIDMARQGYPSTAAKVLRLVNNAPPLIEKIETGEPFVSEDIVPFLPFYARAANRIKPLRPVLHRKIEEKFLIQSEKAMQNARESLKHFEQEIELLATFDNPRQQFIDEISQVAETTTQFIHQRHTDRLAGITYTTTVAETGKLGFLSRVVRKIRHFFGFFRRKEQPTESTEAITAYDAAAGIDQTITSLLSNRPKSVERFPLISHFVLDRIAKLEIPDRNVLAIAAPEILTGLFSALPKNREYQQVLHDIENNPHELRFITQIKKRYGTHYLSTIQNLTRTMLPNIRDALPTSGAKIQEVMANISHLLEQPITIKHDPRLEKPEKKQHRGLRTMFAHFRSHRAVRKQSR